MWFLEISVSWPSQVQWYYERRDLKMLTDFGQQIDVNRKLITYYIFLIRLSKRKVSEFQTNMESLREIWLPDKGEEHHYDCHTDAPGRTTFCAVSRASCWRRRLITARISAWLSFGLFWTGMLIFRRANTPMWRECSGMKILQDDVAFWEDNGDNDNNDVWWDTTPHTSWHKPWHTAGKHTRAAKWRDSLKASRFIASSPDLTTTQRVMVLIS